MNGFGLVLVTLAVGQGAPVPAAAERESASAPAATATPTRGPVEDTAVHPERSADAQASARSRRAPTATATATPTGLPAHPERSGAEGAAESKGDAERAARSFLEALAAGDAEALAGASADRFSFDGEAQAGREAIRRAWRSIVAGRLGPAPRVGRLELLTASDAVARYGKPPARLAPLARPGVLVAVADVGGRTVVLFLTRESGRMAVLGMHD